MRHRLEVIKKNASWLLSDKLTKLCTIRAISDDTFRQMASLPFKYLRYLCIRVAFCIVNNKNISWPAAYK
jgi:hypothetical protein